jgi:DNA-directed RNA polymerase subunit RPC12/RpoP
MVTTRKPRPTSTIRCHKCSHLVALATTDRLPEEFSVRCANCGYRGFYRTKEIRIADAEHAHRSDQAATKAS